MKRPEVVRTVLVEGRLYLRNPDETLTPLRDETDYARLDALSAAEVESIAENDSEAAPMSDEEWARAEVRQPVKKPVGLKLDEDVLTWFKSQGRGYQTRINAVLRRYVEAHRKTG
jgi:uncharacterized protein (DUF4415 family)